jgi:hypothetical protein
VRPAQFGCSQTVVIDAPTESFRIEVSDHSQTAWVAVGEIKELGRQGAWARSLINHGVAFLIIGLGLFVGLTLSAWLWRKYSPAADQVFLLLAVIVSLSAFVGVWSARKLSAAEVTSALQQNWAKNYAKNGDAAGVARHLRLALWLQPNNPAALVGLANCVLQDSSLEKNLAHVQAVAYLEAALRLQPQAESIRKQLAELSGASLPAPEK